jgi:hypothetical protein
MSPRSPLRSAMALLGVAVLGFVVLPRLRDAQSASHEPLPPECQGLSEAECRALMESNASPSSAGGGEQVLRASEVCVSVGYLCADVERNGRLRLLRWPESTDRIHILVPEPTQASPQTARALQRAVVQGIRTWNGHPFPLVVRTRP